MRLTYEEGAERYIAKAFGWVTDEENYIIDEESGERILATDGDIIKIDEMAEVVETPPKPLRENKSES